MVDAKTFIANFAWLQDLQYVSRWHFMNDQSVLYQDDGAAAAAESAARGSLNCRRAGPTNDLQEDYHLKAGWRLGGKEAKLPQKGAWLPTDKSVTKRPPLTYQTLSGFCAAINLKAARGSMFN